MHVLHEHTGYRSMARQVGHTFRHVSMWTVPLVMSLVCFIWGLGALILGKVDGPDMISWSDAALMSGLGLGCLCYVLLGDYFRNRNASVPSS